MSDAQGSLDFPTIEPGCCWLTDLGSCGFPRLPRSIFCIDHHAELENMVRHNELMAVTRDIARARR